MNSPDFTSPLVVFSHLRWDFVFQRPQHLLSRMARDRRVIFIEEPVCQDGRPADWELTYPSTNVLVARPSLPTGGQGFSASELPLLKPMVADLLNSLALSNYVLWLYTPMALPLAQSLTPEPLAVVYDCMDELSAFQFAPPELIKHEAELMRWADVVFTGGRSLYRAKQNKHSNVHCFPSSVDVSHFARAGSTIEPSDQAKLPHPVLGWFGVIDERMNLEILDAMAATHPEWSIVMIGPVVKIEPASLPKHHNIHYLGSRSYNELPNYLAGWDVCIQPFAVNEATRFISPTKTLEYMASDLPIVSTPIVDVVEQFSHIVYLGDTPGEFVTACEEALAETPEQRDTRITEGRRTLALTSWDKTASAIEGLIADASTQHSTIVA